LKLETGSQLRFYTILFQFLLYVRSSERHWLWTALYSPLATVFKNLSFGMTVVQSKPTIPLLLATAHLIWNQIAKAFVFDSRGEAYIFLVPELSILFMHFRRRSDQLYVFWTLESPGNTQYYNKEKIDLRSFGEYYFNGTLTFRFVHFLLHFLKIIIYGGIRL